MGGQRRMTLPLHLRLHEAFDELRGRTYGDSTFPRAVGWLPGKLIDPKGKGIKCSPLTCFVLMASYPDALWCKQDYKDLVIVQTLALFPRGDSPMWAVQRHGIGSKVGDFTAGCWHLVQTWNDVSAHGHVIASAGGHATLAYFDGSLVHVIESTSRGRRGPQFTACDPSRYYNKAVLHIARLNP